LYLALYLEPQQDARKLRSVPSMAVAVSPPRDSTSNYRGATAFGAGGRPESPGPAFLALSNPIGYARGGALLN